MFMMIFQKITRMFAAADHTATELAPLSTGHSGITMEA